MDRFFEMCLFWEMVNTIHPIPCDTCRGLAGCNKEVQTVRITYTEKTEPVAYRADDKSRRLLFV